MCAILPAQGRQQGVLKFSSRWHGAQKGLFTLGGDLNLDRPPPYYLRPDGFPEAACVELEGGGRRPMRGCIVRSIPDYACRKDSVAMIRREASNNAALIALRMAAQR